MRQVLGLWVLNAIDAASTWAAIDSGWGQELNPVMRYFYSIGPDVATGFKILVMTLCVGWFAENWEKPRVRTMSSAVTVMYSVLILWHAAAWHAAANL